MLLINPYRFAKPRTAVSDTDAESYLQAVESADGAGLEQTVADAINDFIIGCKSDGIWSAIKASCLLAGARTLDGALVPLVGSAPTNNNFVTADYDRETGLKGNGSTKYLNSNRSNSADPQNSRHLAIWATAAQTNNAVYISTPSVNTTGDSYLYQSANKLFNTTKLSSSGIPQTPSGTNFISGFYGANRSVANDITMRRENATVSQSSISVTPINQILQVFGITSYMSNGRLSFYSIGESLDLAALDTRVSTLMTDLAAAI